VIRFKIDRLRSEVAQLVRELKAIQLLTFPAAVTPKVADKIAHEEHSIAALNKRELEHKRDACRKEVRQLRKKYGLKLTTAELLSRLAYIEAAPKGKVAFAPLWLLREWFANWGEFLLPPTKVPHHAYVVIDPSGTTYRHAPPAVHGLEFSAVERIVDSTIRLVRKIEVVVFGSDERLRPWLFDRSADGSFPPEVFD